MDRLVEGVEIAVELEEVVELGHELEGNRAVRGHRLEGNGHYSSGGRAHDCGRFFGFQPWSGSSCMVADMARECGWRVGNESARGKRVGGEGGAQRSR